MEWLPLNVITGIVIVLIVLSIFIQIIIGAIYQNMIAETDNMTATENKLLKQCKLKFANCYELNNGVTNIPVFVEKFMNRMKVRGFTLESLSHVSGQLILLSVFVAGLGVYKNIVDGSTITSLLPYYIISMFGLYIYFSVSSMVNIRGRKKVLKTNLIDYLENHMTNRMHLLPKEQAVEPRKNTAAMDRKQRRGQVLAKFSMGNGEDNLAMAGNGRANLDDFSQEPILGRPDTAEEYASGENNTEEDEPLKRSNVSEESMSLGNTRERKGEYVRGRDKHTAKQSIDENGQQTVDYKDNAAELEALLKELLA